MRLVKVSDRIWYSVFDEERDRPSLGYVRGDYWSLAVDAGHSDAHVDEFYEALTRENLPLPSMTALTHWHWDHTFGMHHIHGLSVANSRTDRHLRDFAKKVETEGDEAFLSMDPSIRVEYAYDRPIIITYPDLVFEHEMVLSMGGVSAKLLTTVSPHTDDTTLVYIPEERFLFVGDSICGVFPTWERDAQKARELGRQIEQLDVDHCLGGHWTLLNKRALIMFLNAGT